MIKNTPLGEVARFIRGITFKPEDVCENHADESVVCMRTKNVQTTLDTDDLISVPSSFVRRKEQRLQTGDLLISSANSWNLVGKACWVPELDFDATAGGFISILRCDQSVVDPRYFYHWVTSGKTQHELRNCGRQTTNISNLDFDRAKALSIPLPHKNGKPYLAEQKRIAAILDKADAIRRKRQQALRLTDDFLRSVFLDMFGDPVTNPMGWDEIEFGELVESTKLGMVRSSTEFGWDMPVPYVRMDAITSDGAFLPNKVQGTQATKADIESYGLEPGDFLFNTRNSKELVGKVAVYPGPRGTTFNNNLMRIRFRKSADPYFICQQFQFQQVQRELEARKQGTTSVFAVYWKNLQTLPILCPPPKLQRDFRCIVDKITTARIPMTNLATESNNLFASLQQRAFRGEL